MTKEKLYRVAFLNQGKVYELFCSGVCTSSLLGFIEVSGLMFAEKDSLVVDPTDLFFDRDAGIVGNLLPGAGDRIENRGLSGVGVP